MAKPFQFTLLLQLAIDKREEAVITMRNARQRLSNAQRQLEEIETYRAEYRGRLADSGRQGIRMQQWNDFRLFLARLDGAVEQMHGEIHRCEQAVEATRLAWVACEKEVKAFETLQSRHHEREALRETKLEQRRSDEWVSTTWANSEQRKDPSAT